MKVRMFVSGSAVALAAWLGVTYLRVVPVSHYPQLGRGSLPISAKREHRAPRALPAPLPAAGEQTEVAALGR